MIKVEELSFSVKSAGEIPPFPSKRPSKYAKLIDTIQNMNGSGFVFVPCDDDKKRRNLKQVIASSNAPLKLNCKVREYEENGEVGIGIWKNVKGLPSRQSGGSLI